LPHGNSEKPTYQAFDEKPALTDHHHYQIGKLILIPNILFENNEYYFTFIGQKIKQLFIHSF